MRLFTIILLFLCLIFGTVAAFSQSYYASKPKLDSKPATYYGKTNGYRNTRFIHNLKQRNQYRQHRRNQRKRTEKAKSSPLYTNVKYMKP